MAKLKSVQAVDYKGFEVIDFAPTGLRVKMAGKNGVGKSRIISSLLAPIDPSAAGKAAASYGKEKAEITETITTADGEDIQIRRRWNKGKTEVQVVGMGNGDRAKAKYNAEDILGKLLGPFQYANRFMDVRTPGQERELADALLAAHGVDLKDIDARIEQAEQKRTIRRQAKDSAKARLDAMPLPRPGLPDAEISIAGRSNEIAAWQAARADYDKAVARVEEIESSIPSIDARIERLQRELDAATADRARAVTAAEGMRRALEEMTVPATSEQIAEARSLLGGLEETNRLVNAAKVWREASADVETATAAFAEAEKEVDAARREKMAMLEATDLGTPGLMATPHGTLVYKGVGLPELSDGQRLVVAIAVGLSTRGKLDAIFVDRVESVDAENEAIAAKMCEEAGVLLVMGETVKEANELVIRGADVSLKVAAA